MKSSRYLIIALLAFIVSLTIHKIYDPDFWWQLAAGDRMRATHTVLRINTFSFTHPQHDWLDVYWLYQLALSWLWGWGQATAITAFRLFLVLALAALVLFGLRDRHKPLDAGDTVLLVLAWLLLAPRLTDRPELLSFVLLAAVLALVRGKQWWWCVPLEIIWANVHGFFCWGPIVLLLAGVCEGVAGNRRAAGTATLAAIAAFAASMASPFGWRNWLELPRLTATMRAFAGSVDEFVSPFHPVARAVDGTGWLLIIFLALATVVLWLNRRAVGLFDWLVMAASLPLAVTVRRGVPLFVLCTLPALLAVKPRIEKSGARAAAIGLCLALALGLRIRGRESGIGVAEENLPRGAVEFVQKRVRGPVRLFNAEFGSGGYLIAHGLPVFADGRLEAYPTEFVREYLSALEDEAVFRKMTHEYSATHALVVTTRPDMRAFARRVASLPEWNTLYSDDVAVVLERRP
jgi:hypothetical protein